MIPLTAAASVLLAVQAVDFQRQADGLIAHCRQALGQDPRSGTFVVFINNMFQQG